MVGCSVGRPQVCACGVIVGVSRPLAEKSNLTRSHTRIAAVQLAHLRILRYVASGNETTDHAMPYRVKPD